MRGSVTIKARPLKMALLVDPGKPLQVREAIKLASSLWGGMFYPIIPMYRRMPASWREQALKTPLAKDVFRGYLDSFDPDVLVQFSKELPSYVGDSQLRIIKPQEVWGISNEIEPAYGIGALEMLRDVFDECFKYKMRYPISISIPKIPKDHSLFWVSVFGEYQPHIDEAIELHFSEPLEIRRPEISSEVFFDLTEQSIFFPRRLTAWALEPSRRRQFVRNACIYFMDATIVEDVIDFWNLRATGRSVLPAPKQFLLQDSFKKAVLAFLTEERQAQPNNRNSLDVPSFIRSRHSTFEEMAAYARIFDADRIGSDKLHEPVFLLQHWYPRIWDQWARSRDGGVADIYSKDERIIEIRGNSDLEMHLKPLVPKFGQEALLRSGGVCVNEFDLRIYGSDEHLAEVYPKAQGHNFIHAISGGHSWGDWRIGRHGLVKTITSSLSETRKVPASESIFFAWLADIGWVAELSPPGILAKQLYKRLSGRPLLLANKSILGLIEYMNGGSVNKDGSPVEGSKIGPEREMSVGELKSRLGGKNKTSIRYDDFVERGVFKLGLRTKCPTCQRNSWFSLQSLTEVVECPKCLISFRAAGNIERITSGWYYRTTGPFSVPNYADGAFAVLLTLDFLCERMFSSLSTTAIPSFVATSPEKPNLEADLAMFWREMTWGEDEEGLLFGECKTYGYFEDKDVERMQYLGNCFPGCVLVFSTLRETLTKREVIAISRLAKNGRKYWKNERPVNPVLILTGRELLSSHRPPYCWEESQRSRFSNIRNLLSLCDATQQLYLNLPSWNDDWIKTLKRNG